MGLVERYVDSTEKKFGTTLEQWLKQQDDVDYQNILSNTKEQEVSQDEMSLADLLKERERKEAEKKAAEMHENMIKENQILQSQILRNKVLQQQTAMNMVNIPYGMQTTFIQENKYPLMANGQAFPGQTPNVENRAYTRNQYL